MVELAEEINTAAPHYVASRLARALNTRGLPVLGTKVLLLGVTYKPNIGDRRESPADPLALRLVAQGAVLSYHDPFVETWQVGVEDERLELRSCTDPYLAAEEADAVVLLQPHSVYDLDRLARCSRYVLDTRGVLNGHSSIERL